MKWHSSLREGLMKSKIDSSTYDSKWGQFLPSRRLNIDKELDECLVFYEVDNSEDYLKLDDFNGVDVIMFV